MVTKRGGYQGVADQRYYHFVALRASSGHTPDMFWMMLDNLEQPAVSFSCSGDAFAIAHKKMRSPKMYARGRVADSLSEDGNGNPPFYYDLFFAQVFVDEMVYILIGFPFAALALDIGRNILGQASRCVLGQFYRVDVPRLIHLMENPKDLPESDLSVGVVNVQVSVKGDKSLSAVRIGGDDPLSAALYREYIKPKIEQRQVKPESCALAFEYDFSGESAGGPHRLIRSRLHIDQYGNLKFYMHGDCANAALIALALQQLHTMACLTGAEFNPLFRLDPEGMDK